MGIATEPVDVLRFVADRFDSDLRVALVTLIGIEGSSSRALGNQMAVDENGAACGSFSGGCIDAAIIAEALDVIAAGRGQTLRFGVGSPFIDIRLPCGGGLDLLFTPIVSPEPIRVVLDRLARRASVCLRLSETALSIVQREGTGRKGDSFDLTYHPPLRIVALGQGEEVLAFASLARTFGCELIVATPDGNSIAQLQDRCDKVVELTALTMLPALVGDRWTAFVSLFHDRDWERALLPRALSEEGFFHGAIGSLRTHQARLAELAREVSSHELDRLRGSIGLIPSTRDPATLALSVLAEIVAEYRQCACAPRVAISEPTALANGARQQD